MKLLCASASPTCSTNLFSLRLRRNPSIRAEIRQLELKPGINILQKPIINSAPFDFLHRILGREALKPIRERIFLNRRRGTWLYRPSEEYIKFRQSLRITRK